MTRYTIDATQNGYILTIKASAAGEFLGKFVYANLHQLYEKIDETEVDAGRM